MGTGYTRNDTSNNIADGNIINAADLDGEFDAIESAMGTSGHTHDGTSAEGGPVTVLGPVQDFVASATEIKPKTTNTLDIGTSGLLFKDMFLDGVATIGSIKIDNAGTIGSASDGDAIAISSGGVVSFSQNTIGKTGSGYVLALQTSDTTIEATNVLGKIEFSAPDEASGTDAILVGASIEALAEATFDSATNSTALVFKTNTTGAATERMRLTSAGDLHFLDNRKAIFGAGSDLQIYHDGSDSIIRDVGTGDLRLRGTSLAIEDSSGNEFIKCSDGGTGGTVYLKHLGAIKLNTTSTGIDVTGNATFADNGKAIFGAGSDLQIYHDGSHSYVQDAGTGELRLLGTNLKLKNGTNDATFLAASDGGAVTISYNNDTKLATTSTGIDVTGTVTADSLTVAQGSGANILLESTTTGATTGDIFGEIEFKTNDSNSAGIKGKIDSYSEGAVGNGALRLFTGDTTGLYQRMNIASNGDISFYEDTGTTPKFFWDASAESLGIGTSSPYTLLELSSIDPILRFNDSNGGTDTKNFELRYVGTNSPDIDGLYFRTVNDANTVYSDKMTILGNGNVGIGTSSPSNLLELDAGTGTNAGMTIRMGTGNSGANDSFIGFENSAGTEIIRTRYDNPLTSYVISSDTSGDIMSVTRSGNVGIGTSSPTAPLTVDDTTNNQIRLRRTASGNNVLAATFSDTGSTSETYVAIGSDGDDLVMRSGNSEAMRLDASGNLLVGKTSQNIGSIGFEATPNSVFQANASTASGRPSHTFNRLLSDGDIATFRKDGTSVGSIGSATGNIIIGNGDTGVMYWGGDAILPWNISTNAERDGAISLGRSSGRFEDLYLSGGVYLGGTGAANKLDDYEEGTWTATLSDASSGGNTTTTDTDALYTKIGNVVYFQCAFGGNVSVTGMTSSNQFYIQGLPFTSSGNNNSRFGNVDLRSVTYTSGNVPVGLMADNRTFLYFIETSSAGGFNPLEVSQFSNGDSIYVSGHYITT